MTLMLCKVLRQAGAEPVEAQQPRSSDNRRYRPEGVSPRVGTKTIRNDINGKE